MATSTPNYGLKKFENGDPPDLPSLAASMDKIDTELKKNADNIGLFRAGYIDTDTTANEVVLVPISFGVTYPRNPTVLPVAGSNAPQRCRLSVTNITPSGCDIAVWKDWSGAMAVYWAAIPR